MAMLAEPRRKQKWSVDPRNSAWSKDDSKFGQKMLERMGWSKGKGLGKTEQGATEHIKVKVKNNSLGLGTSTSNEDNWIAHQDDFNQLLADLNNCHGQDTTNEPAQEDKQENFSLEQKSKSSRKRVHYMKFTKGKDLSSRSETDLACIFGKRSKPSRDQDEIKASSVCLGPGSRSGLWPLPVLLFIFKDSSGQDSQEEVEKESKAVEPEAVTSSKPEEPESNTVTSTLTMQEYFAQRMAQLKKARAGAAVQSTTPSPTDGGTNGLHTPTPSTSETPVDSPNISDTEQQTKKKKRKKKRENDEQSVGVGGVEAMETVVVASEETTEQNHSSSSERKKKKKKMRNTEKEEEEMAVEECATPAPVQEDSEVTENISTEKKKKKKKQEQEQEVEAEVVEADQGNSQGSGETKAEETGGKTKKKKRKREDKEEPQEEEVLAVEQKKSKKDKKKRKKDLD
ncbi:PIN2/TERF1-interacting telomerase inhibitor 1 isoform X1 [Alosa sapidissima]|uniref:PIN2/TERF1-interacting telomerase inhibitor 1 isoform X1 n=1 Tax=Alosa sapidissima TaxID=34773 RepID=UPI001C0814AA|nr:PIN2/TERF1-interacting telomerase inhibitor 1 isoform X1 [Alosa sapidissima]